MIVIFSEPMDHALSQRMIQPATISGEALQGSVNLNQGETEWQFVPSKRWKAGSYKIVIQKTIEDLAGNNIGKAFEIDLVEKKLPPPLK